MCLTRSGQVLSVQGRHAMVRWQGHILDVDTSLIGPVRPGDHLLIHAGLALERLAESEQTAVDALLGAWDDAVSEALTDVATHARQTSPG